MAATVNRRAATPAATGDGGPAPRFVGGRLCLDFVNTANWCGAAVVAEKLRSGASLAAWATEAGVLTSAPAATVPDAGLAGLRTLRDDVRALCRCAIAGAPPSRAATERLGAALARGLGGARLTASGSRLAFGRPRDVAGAVGLAVAVSAVDLLTSPARARLRMCPARDCEWLFLDESRNLTRRWCAMDLCGNRAKARENYARRRAAAVQPGT